MIEQFKDTEVRNTGVIYSSVLDQIKGLYEFDPEQAGELAISAIELILTGDISSDDVNIRVMLAPIKKLTEVNVNKYDNKVENQKHKKIVEMKLDVIADLWNKGYKQREIGERVGLSQQVISYRIDVIKKKYPELLTAEPENLTKIQENSTKVCTNLQENSTKIQTTHKNTKKQNFVQTCTNLYKDENFVQKNLENSSESEREQPSEEASKWTFEF